MQRCCLFLVTGVILGCWGCAPSASAPSHVSPPDMHTSRSSIDWAGTYHGVLPCADCSGIDTTLTLTPAHTYRLEQVYMGVDSACNRYVDEGVFRWDSSGSQVELLNVNGGRELFQVGENRVFALDQHGKRIKGELSEAYVLQRTDDVSHEDLASAVQMFVHKRWELSALQRSQIGHRAKGRVWLEFDDEPRRVSGSAGCNRFMGSWQMGAEVSKPHGGSGLSAAPLPLNFSPLATTMMACLPHLMQLEKDFLSAMESVSGMYLEEKELVLVDGSAQEVARFELRPKE